ncbi:hypothetical protein EG329_011688 [Mollisiaceae sp. DMI_Dod_QoI]|nr:hypothetical protein EG329_011688 [Helotiales sp. DMI_Dod_QoI]
MSSISVNNGLQNQQPTTKLGPPTSAPTNTALFKPRIRRKFPRSKHGCLTCRSRRKKCDERIPVCLNCERRKVDCLWSPLKESELAPSQLEQQVLSENDSEKNDVSKSGVGIHSESPTNHSPRSFTSGAPSIVSSRPIPSSTPALKASSKPWYIQWTLLYSPNFLPSSGSRLLFERYLSRTSNDLGITSTSKNPFVGYVLPLAFSNELFMNCVLALSGSDLCCDEAIDPATKSIYLSHYSLVIRGIQTQLSKSTFGDVEDILHLLFLTLALCMIELVTGTQTHLIFHHLFASRHLIHKILSSPSLLTNPDHISLFGFLFELYSYRALGGSIHTLQQLESPVSHSILNLDFFLGSFASTVQYPFYAATFGCKGHLLSAFAPAIASFISVRIFESESSVDKPIHQPSTKTYSIYHTLASQLRAWKPPQAQPDIDLAPEKATGVIIYQNALLIYLHSIFITPQITSSIDLVNAAILSEIQIRIDICLPLLTSLYPSRMEGITLWPSLIIGSCLSKDEERDVLRTGMGRARYKLRTVRWVGEVLERLWRQDSSDPDAGRAHGGAGRWWGPRGLAAVVESGAG